MIYYILRYHGRDYIYDDDDDTSKKNICDNDDVVEMVHPLKDSAYPDLFMGSCNGLVFLLSTLLLVVTFSL